MNPPTLLPTLPDVSDENILLLPSEPPKPVSEGQAIMEQQRAFRHRLVPFQENLKGRPMRNPPKPPEDKIRAMRKMIKRIKRGLPIGNTPVPASP